MRWVGHVVQKDNNKLPKKILWTNPGGQWGCGWLKSRWIDGVEEDARKLGCRNWQTDAQDRGRWWRLKRPRPTQGCRANDDNDEDMKSLQRRQYSSCCNSYCQSYVALWKWENIRKLDIFDTSILLSVSLNYYEI
jgi:hypothetical protein